MRPLKLLCVLAVALLSSSVTLSAPCEIADDGTGTVDLPPECPDGYEGILTIKDGLPGSAMITGAAVLTDFLNQTTTPGGNLGGEIHNFEATMQWDLAGTDQLAGFNRTLFIPVSVIMHTGPRTPGAPVQSFPAEVVHLQGQLFGDPDFCTLALAAGSNFGLASPGTTTLTQLPSGDFAVDSFFDITYQIDFQGCPGSILDGLAGSYQARERFQAGEPYFPPVIHSCQIPDNGIGTIDLPPACPGGYEGALTIIDGLPPGTDIVGDAVLTDFVNRVSGPGGNLGGESHEFDAVMHWNLSGTGILTGFTRTLWIPVQGIIHTGPRTPGDPLQSFPAEIVQLQGQLFGDPDFCTLSLVAGSGFGLLSPGTTTLTQLPSGDFAVDSFFDITYQIEFEGCPGSILEGFVGITTDVERFQAGEPLISGVGDSVQALSILHQNVPNPFNPATVIKFELPAAGAEVTLDVFDLRGRRVVNLAFGHQPGGLRRVVWDGTDTAGKRVAAGVYFYRLRAGPESLVRKMAIIK